LQSKKNILISPLDWGMGHASRIIPIIELLLNEGHNIVVASNGLQKRLLESSFPKLVFIDIVDYNINLSEGNSQIRTLFFQIPKILRAIKKEYSQLKLIIKKYNIDIVISDNRYGLYNKNVKSIFITHQTYIKIPKSISFLEKAINKINTKYINKFDLCWIPDFEGNINLTGDLSHKNNAIVNKRYIGILSRLKNDVSPQINNDVLVVLSGLEPQRSIFENIIEKRLGDTNYKVIIVRGIRTNKESQYGNIDYFSFSNTEELNKLICESRFIVSRSGYSSIMDYVKLNKTAIIVPTPGQTEQEYIAVHLSINKHFVVGNQDKFNFPDLVTKIDDTVLFKEKSDLNKILLDII